MLTRVKKLPALPEWLRHCDLKDGSYPPRFLPKAPIPPSRWLPRDLLQAVTTKPQHQLAAPALQPPTVRPLRVSFASPLTADYALVVCLVQGSTNNSGGGSSVGKLAVVLVDITRKEPAGWLPLSFASNDISSCARRHSAYLQELYAATPSGSTSHSTNSTCAAAEAATAGHHRTAARSRSNVLYSIRLQPLWGNMWAVAGPSLLAVFSINLRYLQHPPAELEDRPYGYEPPLRLLWNSACVPVSSSCHHQETGTSPAISAWHHAEYLRVMQPRDFGAWFACAVVAAGERNELPSG